MFRSKYSCSIGILAWSLFVITILAQCPNSNQHGHSHDHGHGHSHEPAQEAPSFKYSKQANAPPTGAKPAAASHEHGHSHDHGHGHSHDHGHGHSHGNGHEKPSSKYSKEANAATKSQDSFHAAPQRSFSSIWIKALISTFAISCAPLVVLFFIRVDNTERHKSALEYLLSFASGGLLGDAFLHLIPHAVMDVSVSAAGSDQGHSQGHSAHGHSHGLAHGHSHADDAIHTAHIGIGAWVLSGILAFLLVEVIMRALRKRAGMSHGHSHDADDSDKHGSEKSGAKPIVNDSPLSSSQPPQKKSKNESENETVDSDSGKSTRRRTNSRTRTQPSAEQEPASTAATKHKADDTSAVSSTACSEDSSHAHPGPEAPQRDMRVAAYLNLAADFAHNFTDGLAVGAGFLVGDGIGIITAVTVILHEIPHEIGDYAILLKAGCTPWKAIGLQLVTAIGALLGTILSLGLGASSGAVAWILPFTAGGFIYIATVSVLPELLDSGASLCQAIGQILCLLFGVALMAVVCLFE